MGESQENLEHPDSIQKIGTRLIDEVEKAIVGKRDRIRLAVIALLCKGHILFEDIPGVGKTTLAKALAKATGGEFRRVQFTSDLLPSDITGSSVFNQATSQFEFRPGPIFGNVILADEINRATPKTQSALLEAMEESQVTSDGETRHLPAPFFVLATQNSIDMTGTYPLPEAQLDRFFMRLAIGYPSRVSEASILTGRMADHPLLGVEMVATLETIESLQDQVSQVFVHESVVGYIVDIVRATRMSTTLHLGASPRGSLHLMRAAQANAAIEGQRFVRPEDVKEMAAAILGHRVIPRSEIRFKNGLNAIDEVATLINEIVDSVPAPLHTN